MTTITSTVSVQISAQTEATPLVLDGLPKPVNGILINAPRGSGVGTTVLSPAQAVIWQQFLNGPGRDHPAVLSGAIQVAVP